MVDPGEKVSVTLKREFGEEAFASLEMNDSEKQNLEKSVAKLFDYGVEVTYLSYLLNLLQIHKPTFLSKSSELF